MAHLRPLSQSMAQSCLCNCCDSGWFLRGWVCPAQQSRLNKRTWAPHLENETWKYYVGWGHATYTIFSWTMLDACWGVWGVPFEEPEYQGSWPNGKLRINTYGGDFCDECGCDIRPGAGETSQWTSCRAKHEVETLPCGTYFPLLAERCALTSRYDNKQSRALDSSMHHA